MSGTHLFSQLGEGQIRLLDLQPGKVSLPLQGSLRCISIYSPVAYSAYEALSYT
jgi:hypothetical protein